LSLVVVVAESAPLVAWGVAVVVVIEVLSLEKPLAEVLLQKNL
jgi:hypothetical protein